MNVILRVSIWGPIYGLLLVLENMVPLQNILMVEEFIVEKLLVVQCVSISNIIYELFIYI